MHPALIAVIAAGGYALGATGVAGGTLSLQVENDRIARTDRHYTAGERLFYVSDENDIPAWVRRLGRQVPFLADADGTRVGFTLGQSIFTPEDTDARKLVRDDRPYAGWLYGGVALLWEDRGANGRLSTLDTVELDVGGVGPA
ncbi:MAG: lipid A deacylase LpxR family protein, partial [Alphaproteobacteria bacterium]|nr:lipid A deacylase LpxR family protein [Alphaproteobacteria bacterium]